MLPELNGSTTPFRHIAPIRRVDKLACGSRTRLRVSEGSSLWLAARLEGFLRRRRRRIKICESVQDRGSLVTAGETWHAGRRHRLLRGADRKRGRMRETGPSNDEQTKG